MSSLILFLLLSQTVPPQDYVGKLPNFPLQQHRLHINGQKAWENQQYADLLGQGTCFTMRSYVFARQDGKRAGSDWFQHMHAGQRSAHGTVQASPRQADSFERAER